MSEPERQADLLVIGAGPGGYTAAFRAADLGRRVTLIDSRATLGGVCLNVGCIPSKALLHVTRVLAEAQALASAGIDLGPPVIDFGRLAAWKDGVVARLTGGLDALARRRKVTLVRGEARFAGPRCVQVAAAGAGTGDGTGGGPIAFEQAIIAVGSSPVRLPFLPEDPRIVDSTGALALTEVPARMLVLGGGIIGMEMATVYAGLGSAVTVVDSAADLIPGADADLVAPLRQRMAARGVRLLLRSRITGVRAAAAHLVIAVDGPEGAREIAAERMLVAVGRRPNGRLIDAEAAGVTVDEAGFVPVDRQMRTNQPHIFAVGDVVGPPMLAHKAAHEAKVAAEAACGRAAALDARAIPSVAYTDPEIAWVGLTESAARAQNRPIRKAVVPWSASGRALSMDRPDGLTKLLFDPQTKHLLGAGIVGAHAGELVAEAALAVEMGADAEDLSLTVHPHPTLSETLALAAEVFEGSATDL